MRPHRGELTIREALSLFCEREIARKDERRIEMSVGLARFPFVRDLDGFNFAAQPSIDKKQIREIATGRFIANASSCAVRIPCWSTNMAGVFADETFFQGERAAASLLRPGAARLSQSARLSDLQLAIPNPNYG